MQGGFGKGCATVAVIDCGSDCGTAAPLDHTIRVANQGPRFAV
jgi:hypothetical protein